MCLITIFLEHQIDYTLPQLHPRYILIHDVHGPSFIQSISMIYLITFFSEH